MTSPIIVTQKTLISCKRLSAILNYNYIGLDINLIYIFYNSLDCFQKSLQNAVTKFTLHITEKNVMKTVI